MSDNIILNVHLQAAAGQEEALERQLVALLEPTRAEPGCVSYELHCSTAANWPDPVASAAVTRWKVIG